jgi:hypothetical protein
VSSPACGRGINSTRPGARHTAGGNGAELGVIPQGHDRGLVADRGRTQPSGGCPPGPPRQERSRPGAEPEAVVLDPPGEGKDSAGDILWRCVVAERTSYATRNAGF